MFTWLSRPVVPLLFVLLGKGLALDRRRGGLEVYHLLADSYLPRSLADAHISLRFL